MIAWACDTSTIKNLGSFATRDLDAPGEFLAEYCGEIISNKEVRYTRICRHSSAGLCWNVNHALRALFMFVSSADEAARARRHVGVSV